MKKIYLLFFLPVIAFLNFSCVRPDITPAYLIFSEKDFKDSVCIDVSDFNKVHDTNYGQTELEIIRQQDIKDIYVSVNGVSRGFWPLPCTIPVLPDYNHENNIRIIPCVRIVNTTLTTIQYLFLKPVEKIITLEKEEQYHFKFEKFEYVDEVYFPLLETFVESTDFLSLDTVLGADMALVVEEGKNMGKIEINGALPYFNLATQFFDLEGQGTRQFWEMYYKSYDGEMTTYLDYRNTVTGALHQDFVVLPASRGVWKKVYIDLSEKVSEACGTANRISVRMGIRGLCNANAETATFYIGNIKLIAMEARY